MNPIKQIGGGLNPTPTDKRDFSFAGIFGTVPKDKLPIEDFTVSTPIRIKDQWNSDMCTAFALSAVSEDQEGIELSPEYTFAMTKKIQGNWEGWGADLRSVCKSAVKYGFLEQKDAPFTLEKDGRNVVANWNNWGDTWLTKAKIHAKEKYFKIDGSYDTFDNIRSALWKFKNEKRSVITGVLWKDEWTYAQKGIIPEQRMTDSFGHAFKIFGQKIIAGNIFLVAQLSNGNIGDDGLFYFSRAVVNRDFIFNSYMFKDLAPEVIVISSHDYKGFWGRLWDSIKEYFRILL